jgi:hypothetical protein
MMLSLVAALALTLQAPALPGPAVDISLPKARTGPPLQGRLLLLVSTDSTAEPRFQIGDSPGTQQVYGVDVQDWAAGTTRRIDGSALGYPLPSTAALKPGRYWVQAVLNRYETFHRADGSVVRLPPDKGEGQQWNRKPGNLYSTPRWIRLDARLRLINRLEFDREVPPITPPTDTKYIKHERIRSELLSKFWGTDVYLGAHVLLPEGFDTHPNARYPLAVFHGHFPDDFDGFRPEPPDSTLVPDFSARFNLKGYNRIQQELAHDFFKAWTGPGFPRALAIQIQHPTPYYDDSYAVNSANNGPYGDAIMRELIPYLERKYRGIGEGWARITYGGSTGGWEAMAAQVFYPDDFNGAYIACPDPIDFRANTVFDLYADRNAYFDIGPFKRVARPAHRNYLGQVSQTIEDANRLELVLGTKGRSGGQWDIWQAVYSPVGRDGYPKPIWDKVTGVIDTSVAAYWREHFDLMHIVKRDWATLGPKLQGKLHLYVGDMDNYYLNNAVYLAEADLKALRNPMADAEVDYGDRAEHCWNGDQTRSNAFSRLRYHQMFIPRIIEQIRKRAPANADTLSWRY